MEDLDIDMKYVTPTRTRKLGDVGGSYTFFAEGDVLLAKITPCFQNGKLSIARGLTNGVGFGSSEFIVLRPQSALQAEYLYYFLSQAAFRNEGVARMGGSVGQQRVPIEYVLDQRIPLPSLPEQRRIVEILDDAFAAIAKAKANTERIHTHLTAMMDAELQSLISRGSREWPLLALGEIAKVFGRGRSRHRPRNEPRLYDGPYPFVQTGDIRAAAFVIDDYTQTYSELGLSQSKLWPKGTVCITIAANIAESAILGFDGCFPDSVIGVVVDEAKADNAYLLYVLRGYRSHLQALGKGSAQDNINMGTFDSQKFPFPDIRTQREVVDKLNRLRGHIYELNKLGTQKINALGSLKQSLLHHAFTGQLTAKAADRIMATA